MKASSIQAAFEQIDAELYEVQCLISRARGMDVSSLWRQRLRARVQQVRNIAQEYREQLAQYRLESSLDKQKGTPKP